MTVLHEPFSNLAEGLRGRGQIVHFFKVALMANRGLKRTITFENGKADSIDASVMYERGDRVKSRLHFEFNSEIPIKIKLLKIRFID